MDINAAREVFLFFPPSSEIWARSLWGSVDIRKSITSMANNSSINYLLVLPYARVLGSDLGFRRDDKIKQKKI